MPHLIGLLVTVAIILGCAGAPQDSLPAAPPTSSTPRAATTGAPTVALPSESPTPSATAAHPLDIDWSADDPSGLHPVVSIVGVVRRGDSYVLVAELYAAEGLSFAAWRSADGRTWDRVHHFTMGQRILALTAGGPGIVAGGFDDSGDAVIWTSLDGRAWSQVQDASLRNGVIAQLVRTAGGLIGFGRHPATDIGAIWTSEDGLEWLAATNDTGQAVARGLQAVGSYDGRAVAFVSDGADGPPAVWETTGRAEWTRVGSLVDDTAQVGVVAGGVRGWVALGSATASANVAWTSSDGRTWSDAVSGPDVSADLIADDAGFIAVGFVGSLPGETCGDQRPFAGHTWTSADGLMWRQMPVTDEFKKAWVQHLLAVDRTLIGFGQRLPDGSPSDALAVGRWTAPLPAVSRSVSATEPSEPRSCGG